MTIACEANVQKLIGGKNLESRFFGAELSTAVKAASQSTSAA